jgi:hypothetical protein
MNAQQASRVLAKLAAFDNRTVGEANIRAWAEALDGIDLGDALAAVTRHYQRSPDFARPAHIIDAVREITEDRRRREPHPIRALPSRWEADEARAARAAAGASQCRNALAITDDTIRTKIYDPDDTTRDAALRRAALERRDTSPRRHPGAVGNLAAAMFASPERSAS